MLPLLALFFSFGAYAARASLCAMFASDLPPSPIGRVAGVLNYALAVVGAAAMSFPWGKGSLFLEAGMGIVVSVNVAAGVQNISLLARQMARQNRQQRRG